MSPGHGWGSFAHDTTAIQLPEWDLNTDRQMDTEERNLRVFYPQTENYSRLMTAEGEFVSSMNEPLKLVIQYNAVICGINVRRSKAKQGCIYIFMHVYLHMCNH